MYKVNKLNNVFAFTNCDITFLILPQDKQAVLFLQLFVSKFL